MSSSPPSSSNASSSTFLHPASGAVILGLDWLLFSGTVVSLGLSTPVLGVLGFVAGTIGTAVIQKMYGGDGSGKSLLKGLLGGIAVGIPMPIAGTAVGGAVIALSGLNRLMKRNGRRGSSERTLPDQEESP